MCICVSHLATRELSLSDKTNSFWPPATSRNFCRPTINLKPVAAAAALNFNSSRHHNSFIFLGARKNKLHCHGVPGRKARRAQFHFAARPMGPGRIAPESFTAYFGLAQFSVLHARRVSTKKMNKTTTLSLVRRAIKPCTSESEYEIARCRIPA